MRLPILVLTLAAAAAVAAPTRPSAPPPATRPATAPATRPAWTSVAFADPGPATRVVFACDFSGSMLSKAASLKEELAKAVDGLGPHQSFNVLFLQDGRPLALNEARPVPATVPNKRRLYKFLEDVVTSGTSDPLPALRLAFDQQPDLIYVLTDGDFPNNNAVLESVRRLNRGNRVRVNTVAFVNDKDTDTDFLDLLKAVARENGGGFRRVDEGRLGVSHTGAQGPAYTEIPAAAQPRPAAPPPGPATHATRPALPDLSAYASVVFVCDPSAADALPEAKQVVERAVGALTPGQSFGIVFLGDGSPDAMSETHLFPANDTRKAQAVRFVRQEPAADDGWVRGEPGVRLALGLRPRAIVLVGDGRIPDAASVSEAIDEARVLAPMDVHVVQVIPASAAYVVPEARRFGGGKVHRIYAEPPVP